MRQNFKYEELKQKVTKLENKLKELERKEAQQNLQEVTKRLEKIVEMGDDGIIVFDEDYKIVASDLTGYSKDRLLGMDFRGLLSERDIGCLDQMYSEVGIDESKRACTEMELLTANGLKRDIEVCITIAELEKGRVKTFCYLKDITERKEIEKELKESEEKFRNLFERVRHGLFYSSQEGHFLDCNRALLDMLGYPNKEEFLKINIAKDLYVKPEERGWKGS
jgi:PAS domain S-box-containing protein